MGVPQQPMAAQLRYGLRDFVRALLKRLSLNVKRERLPQSIQLPPEGSGFMQKKRLLVFFFCSFNSFPEDTTTKFNLSCT